MPKSKNQIRENETTRNPQAKHVSSIESGRIDARTLTNFPDNHLLVKYPTDIATSLSLRGIVSFEVR